MHPRGDKHGGRSPREDGKQARTGGSETGRAGRMRQAPAAGEGALPRRAEPEGESRLPRAPCLHLTGRLRLREARPRSHGWPGLGLEFELRSMWPPKSQLSPQPPLPVGLDQHLFFSSLLAGTALQWMAGTDCGGGGALCHVPKSYFPQTEFFRSWLLLCDLGQITPFPLWTSFSLSIKCRIT